MAHGDKERESLPLEPFVKACFLGIIVMLNDIIIQQRMFNMTQKKWMLPLVSAAVMVAGCETGGSNNVDVAGAATPGSAADFKANIKDRVFFAFDKSDVSPAAGKVLELQAAWMKTYADKKAMLSGHADARGTADYNMALSNQRAESVKKALGGMGVDAARLTAKGFGKDQPIVPNAKVEAEHAQNRVVVTTISE